MESVDRDYTRWCVNVHGRVIQLQLRDYRLLRNMSYIWASVAIIICNVLLTSIFGAISQGSNYFIVSLIANISLAVIIYYLYEAYGAPVVEEFYLGVKDDAKFSKAKELKDLLNALKSLDKDSYEKLLDKIDADAELEEVLKSYLNPPVIVNKHNGSTRLERPGVVSVDSDGEVKSTGDYLVPLPGNRFTPRDGEDITLEEYEKITALNSINGGTIKVNRSITTDADKLKLTTLNGELNDYSKKFNGLIIKNEPLVNVISKIKFLGRNYIYMSDDNKSVYLEVFDEVLNLFDIMENSGVGTTLDHVNESQWRDSFTLIFELLVELENSHYEELKDRIMEQSLIITEKSRELDKKLKVK